MVQYIRSDLEFILAQIQIAEAHTAAGGSQADLLALVGNNALPLGIRTVDGTFNNLVPGQEDFGSADQPFDHLVPPDYLPGYTPTPGAGSGVTVVDSAPRTISNLISDQSASNPAAVRAALAAIGVTGAAADAAAADIAAAVAAVSAAKSTHGALFAGNFAANGADDTAAAVEPAIAALAAAIGDGTLDGDEDGLADAAIALAEADAAMAATVVTQLSADPGVPAGDLAAAQARAASASALVTELQAIKTGLGDGIDQTDIDAASAAVTSAATNTGDAVTLAGQVTASLGNATTALTGAETALTAEIVSEGLEVAANGSLTITNIAPDAGLSAPFNSWMTLFGQFFDHGLDHINKGGAGKVFIPLSPDDDLFDKGADGIAGTADDGPNFMVLTRAALDANGNTTNSTTPFIDQNQTYASHASVQALLREYVLVGGVPVATGRLIEGATGGMANWGEIKAQARDVLGISLDDLDVLGTPLLATDLYGNLLMGPNGFPQLVTTTGLVEGNLTTPADATAAIRTGHAFLLDIAHTANPAAPGYDAALLDAHFIAGDGRTNENIGLTAVHQIFHSEHNRLLEQTKDVVLATGDLAFLNQWLDADAQVASWPADTSTLQWNGERLFQAAKFGTEMQYQHLVFEEFARKMQPGLGAFDSYDVTIDPAISSEFANVVYRFGHSMLNETVDRFDPNFNDQSMGLIEAFLNPLAFDASGTLTAEEAAGSIVRGMTRQAGNAIDEFVTDALRDNLLGLPLDLAALNLARGRDAGAPSLNEARASFFAQTGDTRLQEYANWEEFAFNLKNPASIINFLAAYGTHPSITGAATMEEKRDAAILIVMGGAGAPPDAVDFLKGQNGWSAQSSGLNDVDLWIGGLAEKTTPFGGMLGSTFAFVFELQLEQLQNGDRFYYLARLGGLNLLNEIEANSFAAMVERNTDAGHVPLDIFSTPDFVLEVDQTHQYNAGLDSVDPTSSGGPLPLVIRDNPATSGADTNYLRFTGDQHVVLGGTDNNDTLIGGGGDDSLWGDAGNDRIEGGDGNDLIQAGDGDDIVTDQFGDDEVRGGNGNDVIQLGSGLNLVLGGFGNDAILSVAGAASEIFGGGGNDFILGVPTNGGAQQGNEGDDWIEGGGGGDGDNGGGGLLADEVPGNDVFVGDGGDDRANGEGGDDIFVGSGGQNRMFGGSGFDWAIYKNNSTGVVADLLNDANVVGGPIILERFQWVEGLSGGSGNDTLSGSNVTAATIGLNGVLGSALDAAGIARIGGLQTLLGAGVTDFDDGDIILGGRGSDLVTGRDGDDVIDGDQWLDVQIEYNGNFYNGLAPLQAGLLNGTINPGSLNVVRTIKNGGQAGDVDTAAYAGNRADYVLSVGPNGTVIVTDTVAGRDGSDTLHNIELLRFADRTMSTVNQAATGAPTISDTTPTEGIAVTADTIGIDDADGLGTFTFQWQVFDGTAWVNIAGATQATFVPAQGQVNQPIRVTVSFMDAGGWVETLTSAATTVVGDSFNGGAANDTFNGTAGEDIANGNGGNDTLNGNDGNDTLNGGAGADTMNGGLGDDVMTGGTGNDVFVVDSTGDIVNEGGGGGTDRISTTLNSFTLASLTNVENLTFTGTGDFTGTGNGLANTITGGAGNDTIDAGGGVDRMVGLGGNDTYFVDTATDVVVEAAGGGNDTMLSSVSDTIANNVETLTLTGLGNINATGNSAANRLNGNDGNNTLSGLLGADTLNGGLGNDSLSGGNANDRLIGGVGNDTMTGGANQDTFVFEFAGFGSDVITDFGAAAGGSQDRLDVTGLGITAATFAADVSIVAQGLDTLITIGADTIVLTAIAPAAITQADFILA